MTDTKKIEDGGPAFAGGLFEPQHGGTNDREPWNHGMSLRDWFAGQALAGMFNHAGWINTCDDDQGEVARRAYAIADAMLAARKAGEA